MDNTSTLRWTAASVIYVRIAVTESNAGSVTATGGYWNCGELEIYGQ